MCRGCFGRVVGLGFGFETDQMTVAGCKSLCLVLWRGLDFAIATSDCILRSAGQKYLSQVMKLCHRWPWSICKVTLRSSTRTNRPFLSQVSSFGLERGPRTCLLGKLAGQPTVCSSLEMRIINAIVESANRR